MNEQNDKDIRALLKQAMPPVVDTEPRRDLWPEMLEKLSRQPVHIPWFDWVLAGLVGATLIVFPGIIPALFYHL
jgi:hypothetical protein